MAFLFPSCICGIIYTNTVGKTALYRLTVRLVNIHWVCIIYILSLASTEPFFLITVYSPSWNAFIFALYPVSCGMQCLSKRESETNVWPPSSQQTELSSAALIKIVLTIQFCFGFTSHTLSNFPPSTTFNVYQMERSSTSMHSHGK